MTLDYSKIYSAAMRAHAAVPYAFAGGRAFAPLRISLMLTYKCNHRCDFCFQDGWRRNQSHGQELSYREVVGVIEQTPRHTLLTLSGGEPFVRRDMTDIVRYAARRNPCNILTTATLLDDEAVEAVVESGVKLVGISIDGVGDKHDALRGRAGFFRRTVEGIRRLQGFKDRRGKRFPLVDVKTMILPQNIGELRKVLDLAVELRADFFTLALPFGDLPFSPFARDELRSIAQPFRTQDAVDVEFLLSELRSMEARRPPLRLRFYPGLDGRGVSDYYRNAFDSSSFRPCSFPWSHLWISPTGQVFPCLSYEIGNVRRNSLKELQNNQRFRAFRREIKRRGVAPSCVGCCYLERKGRDRVVS